MFCQEEMEVSRQRSSSSFLREEEEMEGRSGFFKLLEERKMLALWQTEREVEEEEEELSPAFIKYLKTTACGTGQGALAQAFNQYLGSSLCKESTSPTSEDKRYQPPTRPMPPHPGFR